MADRISKGMFALLGIIIMALTGMLIGSIVEHPPGLGGFQALGALTGALIAIAILLLGEALKTPRTP